MHPSDEYDSYEKEQADLYMDDILIRERKNKHKDRTLRMLGF